MKKGEIERGDVVRITHDIHVGVVPAFVAGERLKVGLIEPNPQRPEYKYVVYSTRLRKKFQLSDSDVVLLKKPPRTVTESFQTLRGMIRYKPRAFIIGTSIAAGILLVVLVGVWAFTRTPGLSATDAAREMLQLREGLAVEYNEVVNYQGLDRYFRWSSEPMTEAIRERGPYLATAFGSFAKGDSVKIERDGKVTTYRINGIPSNLREAAACYLECQSAMHEIWYIFANEKYDYSTLDGSANRAKVALDKGDALLNKQ